MKRLRYILIPIAFLICTQGIFAAPLTESQLVSQARREVLVKFHVLPSRLDAVSLLPSELQVTCIDAKRALPVREHDSDSRELGKILSFRFTDEQSAQEALRIFQQSSNVEWAEPRRIRHTCRLPERAEKSAIEHLDGPPNDPFYPLQWGLERIQAEAGWDFASGDTNIVIAITDLGVDFTHNDLHPQRWVNVQELHGIAGVDDDGNGIVDDIYGYDWVDLDGNPSPENGDAHGTHVAGIAAAMRNNGIGISGIAGNCRVMDVRCGTGIEVTYGYEAIWYAASTGANIINCSWGGLGFSNYENDIIQYARTQGCVVVAAAGNEMSSEWFYPAAYDGVISVAATDIGDYPADFTNYGSWVDISAPGVDIFSTLPQNSYGHASGTSMVCPLVVGAMALVWSKYPDFTGNQIASRLIASADPIDARNPNWWGLLGLGRLNVYRALADEVAGIRLESIRWEEQVASPNGHVEPGERASLTVPIWNELSSAQGVIGLLDVATSHAHVVQSTSCYGDLPPGGPYTNEAPLFEIEILPDAQNGLVVPVTLEWLDGEGHLLARTAYRLQMDSMASTLGNSALELGVGENGCFGFYDYVQQQTVGVGFRELGKPSNLLWHGSLLVAAHGDVSDNCYGNADGNRFDFIALEDSIVWVGPSPRADWEAHASFHDAGSNTPLFVNVDARVLAYRDAPADSFFILEFSISNESLNDFDDLYVGLFMDWDIPKYDDNSGDYDAEGGFAYVWSELPGFQWGGVASVTHPFSAFRLLNNRIDIDALPWDDARKWGILRGGIIPAQSGLVADISEIVGVGPLMIEAGGTICVAMALLAGEDLESLRRYADEARTRYQPVTFQTPPSEMLQQPKTLLTLFPNPVATGTPLQLILPADESAEVRFYNLLGQQIGSSILLEGTASGQHMLWPPKSHASGTIFYRIKTATRSQSGRLLILK
ncbi:S8 family serine peptidase [bacterium]|nr:S8 family serine peptidase [bacterium]